MNSAQRAHRATELLALCAWIKQASFRRTPLSDRVCARVDQLAEELTKGPSPLFSELGPLFSGLIQSDGIRLYEVNAEGHRRLLRTKLPLDVTRNDLEEKFGQGTYFIEARDRSAKSIPGGRTIVLKKRGKQR